VVGEEQAIHAVEGELGNSIQALDRPQMIPIFVGIALGALVGSVPFSFPGAPAAVKLGLAGGPLLVAILLSRLGHVGRLIWYMPAGANYVLRELGILLFLACVGLKAGDRFVDTLTHGVGFVWIGWSLLITIVPVLCVAVFARVVRKMNYITLSGLLAGSMTDPPALAFANATAGSEAPSLSYATVYPLTMLLRVVIAQILVFVLSGN
jgi:putative transport protein